MNNKLHPEKTLILLKQIAKYAGFSPTPGLFDGKTGIAILLYHGSRCFHSSELELVADALIDDIIEEAEQIYSLGFTKGLSGIAWAINHLMNNEFIDFDTIYFDDIDRILFCDEEVPRRIDNSEYPFLGLYILSRYENSLNKNLWVGRASSYSNYMLKLIDVTGKNLFIRNRTLLTPFWYCLLKWKEYNLPFMHKDETIGQVVQSLKKITFKDTKTINSAFADQLFQTLLQLEVSVQLPEKLTITDINSIYFNQLLYSDILLPPKKILGESFSAIIEDKLLLKELLLLLNSKTIGLSHYISGFAWSLLQYNQPRKSQ